MGGKRSGEIHTIDRAHVDEREEKGQRRLRALVLVHAVDVERVPATAGRRVIEPSAQMVLAEKPVEGATRLLVPERTAGDALRIEARGDHGGGLDRLLIEGGGQCAF